MKVCIIGSGGFVGSALTAACLQRGDTTRLISSRSEGGIDPVAGLLPSDFQIEPGTDVVYFLAQSPHYRDMPAFAAHLLSVNCVSAVQAASAAVRAGVKKFLYASTGNVYAQSFAPLREDGLVGRDAWYPLSKLMAEDALRLFGTKMDVTAVRIFAVYGPNQPDKLVPMLVSSVRAGKTNFADRNPSDLADVGGLRVSPIFIDDAIEALLRLASVSGHGVVNLGGKQTISVSDMVAMIGKELGIAPAISISEKFRKSDFICDTSLLEQLTAIQFTSFEDGLQRVLSAT